MSYRRMVTFLAVATVLLAVQGSGSAVKAAENSQAPATDPGAQVYAARCAMCHGPQRLGNPPTFPSLASIGSKMTEAQIVTLLHTGRNAMPAFPTLQGEELASLTHFLVASSVAPQAAAVMAAPPAAGAAHGAEAGRAIFQQNCAFCHGRDTMGGESGPDLTRSRLAMADVAGSTIGEVIRNGRQNTDKKMPAFNLSDQEIKDISAFIHAQIAKARQAKPGGRKGVEVADLQTGNVEDGKRYFNGAGTCSTCHSPTGNLAHVASKYEGLQLEMQMLYPRNVKSNGTVTLPSGEKFTGVVAYKDEFSVGIKTADGVYHSWSLNRVTFVEDAPVKKHAELFPKYTDKDIHDLMAYIQTLK